MPNPPSVLLADSPDHRVSRDDNVLSLRPAGPGREALEAFQSIVEVARAADGDGFSIIKEHRSSERGRGLIDLVLIEIE